jgi:NAD(P)-dependent dehydrogenase (short-subunit alcohol dehydrogenase family)
MRSASAIAALMRTTVEKYGRIDIFSHNAAIAGPGGIESTTEEAYEGMRLGGFDPSGALFRRCKYSVVG